MKNFLKILTCQVVFGLLITFVPSYAQSLDEQCNSFCTDKNRSGENYSSGYSRPDGNGQCKDGEIAVDVCCCVSS